jgi:hypothetical protein
LSQTSLQSPARDTCEPTSSLDRNQFQSARPRNCPHLFAHRREPNPYLPVSKQLSERTLGRRRRTCFRSSGVTVQRWPTGSKHISPVCDRFTAVLAKS